MKTLHVVAFLLLIVGGFNWGLVGFFNVNLVTVLFGSVPTLERVIYMLVGLSALYLLFSYKGDCKVCGK